MDKNRKNIYVIFGFIVFISLILTFVLVSNIGSIVSNPYGKLVTVGGEDFYVPPEFGEGIIKYGVQWGVNREEVSFLLYEEGITFLYIIVYDGDVSGYATSEDFYSKKINSFDGVYFKTGMIHNFVYNYENKTIVYFTDVEDWESVFSNIILNPS